MYLEQIHEANDIKKLNEQELAGLAEEIRTFLVEKISKTGGHLASVLHWLLHGIHLFRNIYP